MLLTVTFSITTLIFVFLGVVYLILYRTFEKSPDKIATTKAVFTGTKTTVYRCRKIYYPVYEYTVGDKKYRKRVDSHPYKPHRNSEAVYLKAFPRIAYISYTGNDFGASAASLFIIAVLSLSISLTCLFFSF